MKEILAIFKEVIEHCKDLPGFLPTLLYQPMRPAMLPRDDVGNALGLVVEDGALLGKCFITSTSIQHQLTHIYF